MLANQIYTMKPLNIEITDIKYRRPGLSKLEFVATYPHFIRRGTIVYDTLEQQFITHTSAIELLAAVCTKLQVTKYRKAS